MQNYSFVMSNFGNQFYTKIILSPLTSKISMLVWKYLSLSVYILIKINSRSITAKRENEQCPTCANLQEQTVCFLNVCCSLKL